MKKQNTLFIVILCVFFFSGCSVRTRLPKESHEIVQIEDKKISLLWSKDEVYTVWSTFDTTIDASSNLVCILGGLDNSTDNNVVCLNGNNGKLLWQNQSGIHRGIAVTPNAIFVIYSSNTGVRKYDPSGKIIWSKHLSGTGSNYLYVEDNQLQILTVPETFWVMDFDGNEVKNATGDKIFVSTPLGNVIEAGGIKLVATESNEVIWEFHNFDEVIEMAPLFIKTKIFVRTGQEYGSVYTINLESGKLLWKTDDNIISNLVYSPSQQLIYALTRDGKLLAINENDGSSEIVAEFSSVPFVLNGEANVGSYQLAYDSYENLLFVSLGDSRQLFAFQEQ